MATAEGGAGAVAFGSGMAALHAAILAAGTPRGATQLGGPRDPGVARPVWRDDDAARRFLCGAGHRGGLLRYVRPGGGRRGDRRVSAQRAAGRADISNPLLKIVNVGGLARLARAAGARLIVDNTIATPIVSARSTSAPTWWSIAPQSTWAATPTRRAGWWWRGPRCSAIFCGATASCSARCSARSRRSLIARGVKTLALRVRQQCVNAAAVATWLAAQPQVARVYYPGLASHPQHELAAQAFGELYGAMVSFDLRPPTRAAGCKRARGAVWLCRRATADPTGHQPGRYLYAGQRADHVLASRPDASAARRARHR